ncbi:MAG: 5'-3' exonuclease H3TH domain-containing protein [Patescibacteria group bacterium]
MENSKQKRFVIFDGHGIIYRAYHAFPPLTTATGELVNAMYGFSRILLTAINELEPEYIAVAFDHKLPTLRVKKYEAYKAQRPEMPDDLKPQIEYVKQVVSTLNIPQFEVEGYEADDLIGTIATAVEQDQNVRTIIVTGDKDLLQLVTDQTHVWIPGRSRNGRKGVASESVEYDPAIVLEKQGITPEQVVDLKAFMGDASDNIPGVKGVGKKTALQLIDTYSNLENVFKAVRTVTASGAADPVLKGALLTKLQQGEEAARLSQELATIDRQVPIEFTLEPCRVDSYDKEAASKLFESFEFRSLIPLLPKDEFELGIQKALF